MKLFLFLSLVLFHSKSDALSCSYFNPKKISERQVLNLAERAENLIPVLSDLYSKHPELSAAISETTFKITNNVDELFSSEILTPEISNFEKLIDALESEPVLLLKRFAKQSDSPYSSTKNNQTWDEIIQNPNLIVAEQVYLVQRNDGSIVRVVFSTKIVNKVIRSKDGFVRTSVKKSLSALKGLGGASADGLVRMIADKTVYEIRFRGKTGNFRFFAYLRDGTFHIVYHTKNSGHTTMTAKRSIESVNGARFSRGH